jgi:hypothetical protein
LLVHGMAHGSASHHTHQVAARAWPEKNDAATGLWVRSFHEK